MNLKRAAFLALLTALPLLLGVQSGDPASLQFRLTQQSEPHVETVTGWMVRNTLAKLVGDGNLRPATPDEVRQHFAELDQLVAAAASSGPARTASPDFDLQSIRSHLRSAEPMVEKSIEESVTRAALASGLGERLGGLELFGPPVYFRFSTLPKLLVVSPRDRIERKATVLLEPDLSTAEFRGPGSRRSPAPPSPRSSPASEASGSTQAWSRSPPTRAGPFALSATSGSTNSWPSGPSVGSTPSAEKMTRE